MLMKTNEIRHELVHLGSGAHALAIQIMGNADDAADAVHDALATVLEKPGTYDASRGPLRPWFLRVVRNRCIDLLRRRRPPGAPIDELIDTGIGPEKAAEHADRDRVLKMALAAITPEQRQIVVLRDYLDLSYGEIAKVLDIAPGTVMSRLHRSRVSLGTAYRKYDD
jgi:RNA polymerase sigma-70 factor, ECF subfamily